MRKQSYPRRWVLNGVLVLLIYGLSLPQVGRILANVVWALTRDFTVYAGTNSLEPAL